MKNLSIISSLLFCSIIASAQVTKDWLRAESTNYDAGTMIATDAENNVFTLGYNFKNLGGGTDIFVTKRDNSGSLLWTNNYDNTTGSQWDAATWIAIDPSGNAIVTGYTNSPLTDYLPVQLIVMKFRGTDGMLLWRKTYSTGSACRAWRVLTDNAGNIYVGGDTLAQRIDHIDYGSLMVKKYSPNGNEIWSVNKDASGNLMQGPMTAMKFTKDGNIVIGGVRGHAPYKNTAAELTTDGTVLWSRSQAGFGATDVSGTADGSVYQLWNDGNVRINKLSSTGSLLWSKTYDFGTGNLGKKIEADQNDDLIITGYVVQLIGLPYTDWMTFKINSGGDQLWSDRYNEHINNDEFPNFMALDNDNNIYITGQGGPFPGGGNLGALQMVTIKYLPDGSKEWVAVNDSIAQSGIALSLTSNNGICVVGSAFAATIQYSQVVQVDCQDIEPNNNFAKAVLITTNAATLSLIQYPADKDFFQFSINADEPNMRIVLSGMPKNYDFILYNSAQEKIAKSKNLNLENDTIIYDNAAAGTYYVKIYQPDGNFDPVNCYTLYVETSATPFNADCQDIEPNNSFAKAVLISTNAATLSLIQYPDDKDFFRFSINANEPNMRIVLSGMPKNYDPVLYNSAQEKIAKSKKLNLENDTIIYNSAAPGTYYVKIYQPDGNFDSVKCYTLYVETSATPFKFSSGSEANLIDLSIYPNPASQFLTVRTGEAMQSEIPVFILDLEGKEMLRVSLSPEKSSHQIDISALSPGMYLMKAVIGNDVVMKKFSVL